jgi:hypothetical protein
MNRFTMRVPKYIENLKAHVVTIHERMHPLDN